ncbi:hypothetical protein JCM10212_004820, partial [Sporobolomyces blumeae]
MNSELPHLAPPTRLTPRELALAAPSRDSSDDAPPRPDLDASASESAADSNPGQPFAPRVSWSRHPLFADK